MTTYQMIEQTTGAPRPLVIKAKKAIIGNRHRATTEEIHKMVTYIKKEQANAKEH